MKLRTLLLALFATATVFAADPINVGVTMAAQMVNQKKVTVIDVRTPEEFAEGHIAGAQNINFNDPAFQSKLDALDKNQAYLVHCKSGGRSGKSLSVFKSLGFTNIYHMSGGFMDWEDAGQPVAK